MLVFSSVVLAVVVHLSAGQDANCDFLQNMTPGLTYNINYNYPAYAARQCRWIAVAASGYRARLNCPMINLPASTGCTMDRFLVSKSGDPQLNNADVYCGRGSTSALSTSTQISVGLITSSQTTGGSFSCTLTSEQDTSTSTCSCGTRKTNRIVGGQETGVNEFPMMAGLVWLDQGLIRCGATIIDKRYVVTAAHCVVNQATSNLAIIVGEHDTSTGADSPATQGLTVERVTVHPQYTSSTHDYDIAILRVSRDIVFSDRVGPACLPFKYAQADFTGQKFTLLGWGSLFFGGPTSPTLQKVDVDVISQSSCQQRVSTLTARQICTYTARKDSCQDDSGGPALFTDPSTGLLHLCGIISFGRYCAETGEPGVHTRVASLLSWITANTPDVTYCRK